MKTADAVVVGGGVVGLALARELAGRGVGRVCVVERGQLGKEASWAAGGMLAPQAEANKADDFFRLLCAARDAYPEFAEGLKVESGWDIELERAGTLYLAFTEDEERELSERAAWQRACGLEVEELTGTEARALEPALSPRVRGALSFPRDWQVENRRLIEALSCSVEMRGVEIWAGVEAQSVRVEQAGRVAGVVTSHGFLSAGVVVVAAGAWTSLLPIRRDERDVDESCNLTSVVAPRIEPVRGQMLCFVTPPSFALFMKHVIYTPRGYVVPRRDGRLLAGSTTEQAGFARNVTGAGVAAITRHALEIAPSIGELELREMWAGLRPRAEDEWPVIGACADVPGLFYSTGHYRNGILLAPLTGALVADMIVSGRVPPPLECFTPERFRRAASCVA